jgi:hypothetical protein
MKRNYPNENTFFPRDNRFLNSTKDYLFISLILYNWDEDIKNLCLFKGENKNYFYIYLGWDNKFYNIISKKKIKNISDLVFKCNFKKSTILSYLKNNYHQLRKGILNNNTDQTLQFDNILIFKDGQLNKENYKKINATLNFKLNSSIDYKQEIIQNIKTSIERFIVIEYDAICCLDGPIKLSKGIVKSPEWTWSALCGREYEFDYCPKCLGIFSIRLICMN